MADVPRKAFARDTRDLIPRGMLSMYPYDNHPWTAQKWVSELDRRTLGAREWLEAWGWETMADAFREGHTTGKTLAIPNNEVLMHHLQMTAQEVAVHELWQSTQRVVLEIHPGMTGHLRSSGSDKFPPMVLGNLVYRNPLVYLGSPVMLKDSADKPVRLVGWYVAGMTNRKQYVDTTDDRATAFHITAVSEVLSDDGKEIVDWDHSRITLPISGADATLDELIDRGLSGFAWDPSIPGQSDNAQRDYISSLLHVIVPHMLYLVSQNLESKPRTLTSAPPPKRKKWDKTYGGGKSARYQIGFNSGAVLASLEHWDGEETEPREGRGSTGSKRSSRPHMRRAHFHTYWAGEGTKSMTPEERLEKAERRVKWLSPISVNADNGMGGTTVVKIR